MKNIYLFLLLIVLIGCQSTEKKNTTTNAENTTEPINEKTFIQLGGEDQYIEITGANQQQPILLFLHGGPGWPQTPHLRYFNSQLSKEMMVVSWDQPGCGKSYLNNPNPKNLSVKSLISNAHELTQYLKKKFNRDKIFLLGFSYGSVIGLNLADKYPEDYHAYIGVSQIINAQDNWDISMQWLRQKAQQKQDTAVLKQLDLIDQKDTSVCNTVLDCFMSKYQLLVDYNGTILNPSIAKEIEKAEHYYEDYKDYNWFDVFYYTYSRLGDQQFQTDLTHIKSIDVPTYFMAGKHDWNLPGVVAEKHLKTLNAPKKEFIWFENSGHEPPEEEPELFNKTIIKIVNEINE